MTRSAAREPPDHVLEAFGADAAPTRLEGGHGLAWRAGGLVVKPADAAEDLLAWESAVLAGLGDPGLRLAPPLRSRAGTFVVDGWTASAYLAGDHEPRRWLEVIAAGDRLHAALAGIACPAAIGTRRDPWAVADRVAWGEAPQEPWLRDPGAARLARLLAPVVAPRQVIHGDLTGNVLFADPLPPAVIDFAPCWRPAGYAAAIVVADALAWEGATPADLEPATEPRSFGQLLLRAILFRVVTGWIRDPATERTVAPAYGPAIELAARLVERDG